MNQTEAKKKIAELVDKYVQVKKSGKIRRYSEEDTKKGFIVPLFRALGWDFEDREEVSSEEHVQSSGFIDYGFYLNGRAKFYLEAKKFSADIHSEEFAKQAIRYSWNRGVTWAVLTDFESLIVFYAQSVSDHLGDKLYFEIRADEYIERFDDLWRLSKEGFANNVLDSDAEKSGKKYQKISVTDTLYKDLNESRALLLKSFHVWNKDTPYDLLEEGVQKMLDRLIFIRVAEDRGLEDKTLLPMLRAHGGSSSKDFFKHLVDKFRELDKIYNSNLFARHPFEDWEEYDGKTGKVINTLYGKQGYYEYDFKAIPADILGSVYENYLGYKLLQSDKGLEVSKDARKRKEQGIYYTPTYIVDCIVTNALKPVLDKCNSVEDVQNIKVLDPACGSGSFLIRAMEMIFEWYKKYNPNADEFTKISILQNNIFGVDLDEQAVEIAQLNLLITALDSRMPLPNLSGNIKNGNSLISGTDVELEKAFGKNYRDKKPFNWQEQFLQVFNRDNPGFDVIIGNPPYGANLSSEDKAYFYSTTKLSDYQLDTYLLFLELSLNILNNDGLLGMIVPNTWLTNIKVDSFRSYIVNHTEITELANYSQKIFPGATVDNNTLIVRKKTPEPQHTVNISLVTPEDKSEHTILQSTWQNAKVFNIFTDKSQRTLMKKIESGSVLLNDVCKVTVGIKPYQTGKGKPKQTESIVKERKFDAPSKLNETYRQYLRGKDINRYSLVANSDRWISYGEWLAEPRDPKIFNAEKILVRQTGDRLIATFDSKKFLCLNNLHVVNITNPEYSLKYILAILNSKLLDRYYEFLNPEKGEALAEVKATNVKRLPVKTIATDQEKDIADTLVSYSEKMIDLNTKLSDVIDDSNGWHSIKSEIKKTDHQIDQLVYKLYNLTPGEIKIIEKN